MINGPVMASEPLPPVLGAELREFTDTLAGLGMDLASELDDEAADLVRLALDALQNEVCHISVIGQVKAGKTSLVNALIRRPGLLPVASKPWTAVITRLNFGLPNSPTGGATFSFFSEAEWNRLAESGGRVRELAERLLPGFDPTQLRRQLAEMRERAATRLGPKFSELLGKAHIFDDIDPETLERYIAAEGAGSAAVAEHYSDITRVADLYFNLDVMGFPLTLIDAPGTNDPFLVREEITLRMIEDSEASVIVVAALDTLDVSDLALLRLLRGLRKNRLVLFVNRIDELSNLPRDIVRVEQRLRKVIAYELPGAHIPIVFGSARWASLAVSQQNIAETEIRRLLDYASHLVGRPNAGSTELENANVDPQSVRKLLLHCSGIRQLEGNLSWLMMRGRAGYYAHQVATTFAALSENMALSLRSDLQHLRKLNDGRSLSRHLTELQRRQTEQERQHLNNLSEQLRQICSQSIRSLDATHGKLQSTLTANLRREIYAFARRESMKIEEALRAKQLSDQSIYRCDTSSLRNLISQAFVRDYRWARQDVVNTQRMVAVRLRQLLADALPDFEINLDFNALGGSFIYPPLAPLGQALAFDLEQSWWAQWWRRRRDPANTAKALEQIILREYLPLADELVEAAMTGIAGEVETAKWWISLSGNKLAVTLDERAKQLSPLLLTDERESANGDNPLSVTPEGLNERIKRAEAELQRCLRLSSDLRALVRTIEPHLN